VGARGSDWDSITGVEGEDLSWPGRSAQEGEMSKKEMC
jgi:hypothetical protein